MGNALLVVALLLGQTLDPWKGLTFSNPLATALDGPTYQKLWERAVTGERAKSITHLPLSASAFTPAGPRFVPQQMLADAKQLSKPQRLALLQGIDAGFEAFEQPPRKHNLAWALALALSTALQVAYGRPQPDEQVATLALELNDVLAVEKKVKAMTAKQKQQLYEAAIASAVLIGGFAQAADEAKDPAQQQQAKAMAEQVLATFQPKKQLGP